MSSTVSRGSVGGNGGVRAEPRVRLQENMGDGGRGGALQGIV